MRKAFRGNRALLLVVALATSLTVITSAAVGLASSPDEISLTIGSNSGQFEYDEMAPQVLEAAKSSCKLNAESTNGPIMELDATTFARNGNLVDPAPIGLVGGRLGVNKNGNGNDSSCGRIDWLQEGQSEALTMTLGSALGKVMVAADFTLDSKPGDNVQIEFFLDGSPVGSTGFIPAGSGVDVSPADGSPFDSLRITAGANSNIGITGATFSLRDLIATVPTVAVQPRDEVTQIGSDAIFDFTIDNTASEVPAAVQIREIGASSLDCDLTAGAGSVAYCSTTRTVEGVDNEISFEGSASVPTLVGTQPIVVSPTPVAYLGGYRCGEAIVVDGPDVTGDGPDVGFVLGPDKTGDPTACAVPVEIATSGVGGTIQSATVEPPAGYTWTDVTGVVTIAWDAVAPTTNPIPRTFQEFSDGTEVVIPWCSQVVDVQLRADGTYELADLTSVYNTATGSGDVCQVFQFSETVADTSGTVLTQTTEVFYIYEDPKFVRR